MSFNDASESEWNTAAYYFIQLSNLMFQAILSQANKNYGQALDYYLATHNMIVAHMKPQEEKIAKRCYNNCKVLISQKQFDEETIIQNLNKYNKILRVVMRNRRMDIPRARGGSGLVKLEEDTEEINEQEY